MERKEGMGRLPRAGDWVRMDDGGLPRAVAMAALASGRGRERVANGGWVMGVRGADRGSGRAAAGGSALRGVMLLVAALVAVAMALAGWGAWRLERGQSLPPWLARLAVAGGLVGGDRLAEAARAEDERRVADAVWRNEAANRVRGLDGVRAVAWDGDRLLAMLAPGVRPSGGRADAICAALAVREAADPVRVRLESLDGQAAPVERWCGSPGP